MAVTLEPINPNCEIKFDLIDSKECVGNSLDKINAPITGSIDYFKKIFNLVFPLDNPDDFIQKVSTFSNLSSFYIKKHLNIFSINESYKSPYTVIQKLSAQWNKKEFTIYFPFLFDITSFYNNNNFYSSEILSWIDQKFPAVKYPINQIVNVYVSLTYTNFFNFTFFSYYNENCSPTAHSDNTLTCTGCGGDRRNAGCNIKGVGCFNPYTLCRASQINDDAVFNCSGTVGNTLIYNTNNNPSRYSVGNTGALSIYYSTNLLEDMFMCRILKYKIKNNGSSWEVIT